MSGTGSWPPAACWSWTRAERGECPNTRHQCRDLERHPRRGGHGWTPPRAVRVRAADDGQVVPRSFSAAASRRSPGWWRRPASTPRSTTPACCCPCTPSASPSKARWSTSRPTGCGNESCPPTSRRPASLLTSDTRMTNENLLVQHSTLNLLNLQRKEMFR